MELEELQKKERRDRRDGAILLLLALLLSCSCVFLSTNLAIYILGRTRLLNANILAQSEADYGPDNYQTRLPAPNPSVIAIALTDEAALQITPTDDESNSSGGTPIALVTTTPLPPPPPTGIPPTATAVSPTSTSTASATVTPSPTASPTVTALPTGTSTSTPTVASTPVASFTPIPTATPTSLPVPTNTSTPKPPNPTKTPTPNSPNPTQTPTPNLPNPTNTPTSVSATATPTFTPTSIPPTVTPTFTSVPPTVTPTFTSVPPTVTPTFTAVPATFTPTPTAIILTSTFTPTPTNTPTASPTSTPTPTPSREALVVVADPGALNSTDTAVQNRLIALSFDVILADDNTVVVSDTLNRELVYISDSVNEGTLGGTLCDARAPVIVAKAVLYDEMNMAASNNYEPNQTGIDIVDPTHPIAAGLSGTVTILTGGNNIGWGNNLQPGVQQVASVAGDPSRTTIFAYPASANVTCTALPVRRVGFPLASGAALTLDGWRIFDAAVNWIVP